MVAAVFVVACLPFGGLWADWLASLANSRGGGLLYSSLEIPMLLLPLAAWLGRTQPGAVTRPAVARHRIERD